jgi:hypothetical protein
MDARLDFSIPMDPSIEVTATKEEWQSIIERLLSGFTSPEGAPADLIHWLINQGVYD